LGAAVGSTSARGLPRLAASPALDAAAARELIRALQELSIPEAEDAREPERFYELAFLTGLHGLPTETIPLEWGQRMGWDRELSPVPSAVYLIPLSAIEWDEALRLVNRRHDLDAVVGARTRDARTEAQREFAWVAGARRSLEAPRLTQLIGKAPRQREARLELTKALVGAMWDYGLPSFGRANRSLSETSVQRRLGLAALALATFRAERGGLPASLEALVPEFLSGTWAATSSWKGYVFRYHPGAPVSAGSSFVSSFAYAAAPEVPMEKGVRGFCVDDMGRVAETYDSSEPPIQDGRCQEPPSGGVTNPPQADSRN
jgi:hypothetical protein